MLCDLRYAIKNDSIKKALNFLTHIEQSHTKKKLQKAMQNNASFSLSFLLSIQVPFLLFLYLHNMSQYLRSSWIDFDKALRYHLLSLKCIYNINTLLPFPVPRLYASTPICSTSAQHLHVLLPSLPHGYNHAPCSVRGIIIISINMQDRQFFVRNFYDIRH